MRSEPREHIERYFVPELTAAGKQVVKRLIFPGADVHARSRYRHLPLFFTRGPLETLDAGCGNGMLSYAAYRLGNRVIGVTMDADEIRRNVQFFSAIGTDPKRLLFKQGNLYELPALFDTQFDQIVCSETLEHILDDSRVVGYFAEALRPGGVLHLCCPNANHPEHAKGRSGEPEDGRHVRDGYTIETYRRLLAVAGLQIDFVHGIGTSLVVRMDRLVRRSRERFGHVVAVPLCTGLSLAKTLDRIDPPVPYSIYVRASRP